MTTNPRQGRKVPVHERALLARLNRHPLKPKGAVIKKCKRTSAEYGTLGDYYMVDRSGITATRLDLAKLAKEWGALRTFERLAA